MKNITLLGFVILLFSLTSCTKPQKSNSEKSYSDSLTLDYATGFSVLYNNDYKLVIVNNPWIKSEEYARYYLVTDSSITVPSDGYKIIVPLKSIATSSTTHYEFLNLLGEIKSVSGTCQTELVYNKQLQSRIANGEVVDLGDALKINVEKTLHLQPSALMMSGYNQNDVNALRIAQAGIPVIFNNEWTEPSLLARAEWIKFVAAFYNKEHIADSIFSTIETSYNLIKEKAEKVTQKPSVMAGSNFRGTWYVPAGNSFMGKLFADAGALYFYANDTTAGSLPLNVETVIKNFSNADIWLNCNYSTMEQLKEADNKHMLFRAAQNRQVYNFNKRMLTTGANDFWESAVARPDLLLSDVIAILHPEILPDYELFYSEKLK